MPKRTSNSSSGKGVLAILMLTVFGAGGLAAYVRLNPAAAHVQVQDRQTHPDVSISTKPVADPEQAPTASSDLLVPVVAENDVKLGKAAQVPQEGVRPEVSLINETLASLKVEGARAIGIDVQDRHAVVSFTPEIEQGYGTIEEGYLIKGLSIALGQFKDIDKFQIAVNGKIVDSLGNIDLATPVEVIREGQSTTKKKKSPINP